jgi:hypothetical protein
VVTTGAGFDYDTEIDQHLVPAVIDLEKPLPANPAGVAALSTRLAELAQPSTAKPVEALPETARAISGKTYVFEPNRANLESLGLDFNDSAEAVMRIKYFGDDEVFSSPLGLDGLYRPTSQGELRRGYWSDPQTFALEIYDVGKSSYQVRFEDDKATLKAPEQGLNIQGKVNSP